MSRILEAYRKRGEGGEAIRFEAPDPDRERLFPPPTKQQRADFSQLVSMMVQFRPARSGAVFCFASSVSGEGASYVSYNVARVLAQSFDRHVAWVDANFRSPQRSLADSKTVALADLLDAPERVSEIADSGQFVVIPSGAHLEAGLGRLTDESCGHLFAELAAAFDFVIIDAPPILESIEAGRLAARSAGLVLVIERKRLKWEIVQHGLDDLAAKKVRVLGAVLNKRDYELPRFLYNRL
jgi:Mrp family chromosome partitioning ATPase